MTTRFLVAQLTVWAVACGSQPPTPLPEPTSLPEPQLPSPIIESGPAALVRRADEALASTLKPDYERPQLREQFDLPWVSDRYLEACRAGDRRSCWLADTIFRSLEAEEMVRRNCRAGDLMSCRAIRAEPGYPADKPLRGWVGRWLVCTGTLEICEQITREKCEALDCRGALREECAAGFARSCWHPHVNPADRDALAEGWRLAREGCRAGILEECRLATFDRDSSGRELAYEQLCTLAAEQCSTLSTIYENSKNLIKARDALERGCQSSTYNGTSSLCGLLENGYRDGLYPEPVPGRGRALAEWQCRRLRGPESCLESVRKRWPAVITP